MPRADSRPDSDIDLRVPYAEGQTPRFFGIARMEHALSALHGGRNVDPRTRNNLSRSCRDHVEAAAEGVYASPGAAPMSR